MISYSGNVNFSPSIVCLPNGYYDAAWIEYYDLAFYYSAERVLHYYGSGVGQSCSINRGGGSSNSGFVAWSQSNGGTWSNRSLRFDNGAPNSGTLQSLSTSGKYVQVANGVNPNLSGMRVSSFYPFTSPYTFATSSTLAPLPKGSPQLVEERGFMINKGDASFSYRFGDLNVDGKDIGFVDVPDSSDYGKIDILNGALITKPFHLDANSKVIFTERSGFADSAAAAKSLGKDGYVQYKVELMDNSTGKPVGKVKDVIVNSLNAHPYRTFSYLLKTKGIGDKTVRARITLTTNVVDTTSISFAVSGDSLPPELAARLAHQVDVRSNLVLIKSLAEQNAATSASSLCGLIIEELDVPATYALSQNYPNPFNPTTVISYQISNDGLVTLKIYDVLGREVETLVNANQQVGRYDVTFDGSKLASGVYFYRLVSGNRVMTKKMLLVK
jgi:hypothetical protein